MKTIKFKYIYIAVALAALGGSCSEDFVTIDPKGKFDTSTYFSNEQQCYSALIGVYDPLRKNTGGFENLVAMLNAGSDDFYAGGGGPTDGTGIQNFSTHSLTSIIVPGSYWGDHYQGVSRANILLAKLPAATMDNGVRARFAAESKALRAFYYFNLVRLFKNIPLILEPLTTGTIYDPEQVAPEVIYAQIEKDLLEAIPALPNTVVADTEAGRFNKGAAQALLGKVYLFEGKKTEAATVLAQVNGTPGQTNQYGNKLLANFSDLWVTSNKFNTESLIEVSHTSAGNSDWTFWGSGKDEGNSLNVMVGPRGYSRPTNSTAPDLPAGWSFSVPTQKLYDAMKTDPRFAATILDVKALKAAGQADYIGGYQDTGYFLNKYLPRQSDVRTGGGNAELNYKQNSYVIRLADTYLMEAEALGSGPRAQALLDAVRARVGLASVPVTLAAIKNERRMELAGEGHRFFDLVRWGDAATALADRGFNAGTDEIFPIPYTELNGTKLKQNPNYQ
ncbi:Starch-binding associating with outer membrane [Flavobacterium aquidurense]|uniref:RagB/SusD family nutrient uptake outer membrane protein n=1 Tax=Flavobacterium frigidimaris TaxID=262320 RepID=A0ABX4BT33_FLAFR|nr:RagB/SusD family nutrient uptake outer membrane protein [Flavobacterium frigidimaris]OXA79979.1 RagB/SusD family nutrient uptake outer membrane protein [Flavobacterium frigidimaris]SDZ41223.1 Starch-binding associating with outer membrane [Flavobacterium aquidurense]